jgi:Asp/Glu/hydantoin racemase
MDEADEFAEEALLDEDEEESMKEGNADIIRDGCAGLTRVPSRRLSRPEQSTRLRQTLD